MLHAEDVADADLAFLVQKIFALREGTLAVLGLRDRLALRHDHLVALELPLDVVFGVRLSLIRMEATTARGFAGRAAPVLREQGP